jgi:hypothetical protein
MKLLARTLIWNACFLEFSDDSLLDPDAAVGQLERMASTLQEASPEERAAFIQQCKVEAEEVSAEGSPRSIEVAEFLHSLPEHFGLG